jgi:hypothetical protein
MVQRIPRWRRYFRLARDPYALSPRTRSGLVRGRPPCSRGTRIFSSTGMNCGLSPRWPAVTMTARGFWPWSTARWNFVVSPPRDRPSPWSPGSGPGGSFCAAGFFLAPAACWCARAVPESTDTSQVTCPASSARAWSARTMTAQVPSSCQRRNSPYTDCQGPYSSGTSRHGDPVRVRHRIPSISCRRLHLRGRPGFFPAGSRGSRTVHSRSPRS